MIQNPLVAKSVEFHYDKRSRALAMMWAVLAVVLIAVFLLGSPWGDAGVYFAVFVGLAVVNIKSGYHALTNQPVISFTSTDFEFHGDRGMTGEGKWGDVDLINDEAANHELYIHLKNDAPVTLITKGLASSHEEIKKAAMEFQRGRSNE